MPDTAALLAVVAAAFAGSLASGLTGAGAGVVLSIALLPVLGVRAIVPVLSVAMVVGHLGRLYAFRRQVDWRGGALLVATALPGSVTGTMVYARLSETATAAVLGVVLTGLVVLRSLRPAFTFRLSTPAFAAAGLAFGFLNGLTVGAGVLVLPLLMFFGLSGIALVATDALVGLGMNLMKAVAFAALGVLEPVLVLHGVLIGLLTVPGAFVARALIHRLSIRGHARLIDLTILVAAGAMLFRAGRG